MDTRQLLIQAIGFGGTVLFFFSYQCRENRRLFQVQLASYLLYTVHLLLLGAVTGGISYILNTLRSFCLGSRYEVLKGKAACALICLLQLTALYFTWGGWQSVLPVAANIAATVGGYTRDGRKIRLVGMLVNSPLWIVYDLLAGSWAGILDEIVSEASMILSICRYGWKNLENSKE
ncbi:MAG TPA: YgjV family protein [Clostridiales bacterium]|nr:YgjV family protein [Clostridiales bacterium]